MNRRFQGSRPEPLECILEVLDEPMDLSILFRGTRTRVVLKLEDLVAGFEVFDKRSVPLTKQPMATIQMRGLISMNKAAYHSIGQPAAVELLYDRESRVVGLRGVNPDEAPHAYPVRPQGQGNTFMVAGHAFFKYYGVDVEVSRRYRVQLIDDILCIDLKDVGVEVVGHRRKAAIDHEKSVGPRPVSAEPRAAD